jgi:hypothetical protein
MDAAERDLLRDTIRAALNDSENRADGILAELGWLEMLAAEPRDAIDIVFDALGATNSTATALDDVVASALGTPPRADLAVVLPRFGSWDPPGRDHGGSVRVSGLATARAGTARELLVVCDTGSSTHAVIAPRESATVHLVRGIDPDAAFHTVRIDDGVADGAPLAPGAWETAVAHGRRAVAYEISGAGRTMLALACAHALERVQFGRAIASFQAVRHRLAEALVAVESLDATLHAAADEPSALTAALAKATAGRTARTVATHCQQVLAGIGFTTDHPFHRFLKRTIALDGVFGSADDIAVDIGRQLIATRNVPTLIEL